MAIIIFQKKRNFRTDPSNPYKTRYMIYNLIDIGGSKCCIEVEQCDYVLRNKVAEEKITTPDMDNPRTGRQLIEYMLKSVKDAGDVTSVYYDWRRGKVPLISENKNVLVKEAIRRRFARNLKKM